MKSSKIEVDIVSDTGISTMLLLVMIKKNDDNTLASTVTATVNH